MNHDRLRPVIEAVEAVLRQRPRAILAIDGMAAAGKTTAAGILSPRWNAPIVHMDDFYLPVELRTPERLAEPGGNVHYERFAEEVLPCLARGEPFSYRRFSCSAMTFDGERRIGAAPVVIVEGAYALHPRFGSYADVAVFYEIEADEQKRRIVSRNGAERWPDFQNRWIPMENRYHEAHHIRAKADIIL